MKNKEKYAKEIMDIACSGNRIAVMKGSGRIVPCDGVLCSVCLFCSSIDCRKNIKDWSGSEYIEKVVINKRDRMFLEYLNGKFKYIARDKTGYLYVYSVKPDKRDIFWSRKSGEYFCFGNHIDVDFPMVKWEDDKPWLIGDLKKLEVVEEYD